MAIMRTVGRFYADFMRTLGAFYIDFSNIYKDFAKKLWGFHGFYMDSRTKYHVTLRYLVEEQITYFLRV